MDYIVNGLILSSVITLGGIGLSLNTAILKFYNFAHGAALTLGAYVALFILHTLLPLLGIAGKDFPSLSFGFPMLVAMVFSMGITAGIAIAIHIVVYKPLKDRKSSALILGMSSLFMALFIRNGIRTVWGPDVVYYSTEMQMIVDLPYGIKITPDQIFMVSLAIVLVVLTQLFLKKTKMGKAMRASADSLDLAEITGIDTEKVVLWTWGIGTALAAAGGILYGITVQLRPIMGWYFLLPLFCAVIIGGEGNIYGVMGGALVVGMAQEVGTPLLQSLFDSAGVAVAMTGYKPAIAFILMVMVLLIRSIRKQSI